MGNFKKVRLTIESTGYMYTTDESNIEGWEEGLMDENEFNVIKVEVVEEYNLSPQHIVYINSDDFIEELEREIEKEILCQSRDEKICSILKN
jgi:hypothetical protein